MHTTEPKRTFTQNSDLSALVNIPLQQTLSIDDIWALRRSGYPRLNRADLDDIRVLTTHASDITVSSTTPTVVVAGPAPKVQNEATVMKAYLEATSGLTREAIRVSGIGLDAPDYWGSKQCKFPDRCDPEFSTLVGGDLRDEWTWRIALGEVASADLVYMRNPYIEWQGNFLLCVAQSLLHLNDTGSLLLLIRDEDVDFFSRSTHILAANDIRPLRQIHTELNAKSYTLFEPHHTLAIFRRPPSTAINALMQDVVARYPNALEPLWS
jgi:hypothetical protein